MKWIRAGVIVCWLLFLIVLLKFVSVENKPSEETAELLNITENNCEEICWEDIEVGFAHKDEALIQLAKNDLVEQISESNAFWISAQLKSSILWQTMGDPQVVAWLDNDIVVGFDLPVRMCAMDVFFAHGIPLVSMPDDPSSSIYNLYYPNLGLSYGLDIDDGYTIRLTIFSSEAAWANAISGRAVRWDNSFELDCN